MTAITKEKIFAAIDAGQKHLDRRLRETPEILDDTVLLHEVKAAVGLGGIRTLIRRGFRGDTVPLADLRDILIDFTTPEPSDSIVAEITIEAFHEVARELGIDISENRDKQGRVR